MSNSSQTGFTSISAKFDTTGIENPFYESSSKGDSLIEQMKNNILLVNEVEINVGETKKQKQKITPGSYLNSSAKKRYEAALCKFYYRTMQNFELTTESKVNFLGIKLFRVKITKACKWGRPGDLGGWVEKYGNILGNAWISENAEAFGDARIFGDAEISGKARIFGDAQIFRYEIDGFGEAVRKV